MSLDTILRSVDALLVDVSQNVNRLILTLTLFLPVFIVSFALLVVTLIVVVVITLVIQCKKLRRVQQLRRSLPSYRQTEHSLLSEPRKSPIEAVA